MVHSMNLIFLKSATTGKTDARRYVWKKFKVLDTLVKDSNLLQMLDIIENVIADLPDHNEADRSHPDKRSELTHYQRVAQLLDIIFRDSNFDLEE